MTKKELYKSKFSTVTYYVEQKLMEQKWHNNGRDMTDDDYKLEMQHFLTNFHPKADKFLVDSTGLNLIVNTELQQWVGQRIASKLIDKVNKAAFLVPSDIFEEVSIEQANVANPAAVDKTEYFDSAVEAMQWLNA